MSRIEDDACVEIASLATEYLESALTSAERAQFEAHLRECPGCVTYLDQIRTTAVLAQEAPRPALAPDERDAFLEALRRWKRERGAPGRENPR